MAEEKAVELIGDADILLAAPSAIKPISKTLLDKLPELKHIALVTAGYDWVDIRYCRKKGISVSSPIGANSEEVAEHIFGLFLDLAKRITEFYIDVKESGAYDFRNYRGTELYNKTLGIIGLGNIGHKVARIAKGFEMKILVYDRLEKSTKDYKVVNLDELVKKSDYIAVSIPLTCETKNLINSKQIDKMKQNVIIANISREGVANETDMVKALEEGIVLAYGWCCLRNNETNRQKQQTPEIKECAYNSS